MRELSPDRPSDDGTRLVVRDPQTAEEFTVPIDDRFTRLLGVAEQRRRPGKGPRETTMQSSLSPRDIQTRIRRGETLAEVADAAGVEVEQIQGFATPVLAERAYMAEQARTTPLRRKHVPGGPVALGHLVDEQVVLAGGTPEDTTWDAWRREDGRWAVVATPADASAAHFIFDVKSRYVLPADDQAKDLVGDVAHPDESSDMDLADAIRQHDAVSAPADDLLAGDTADHAPVTSLKEARDRRAMEQLGQPTPAADPQQYTIADQLGFDDLDDEGAAEPAAEDTSAPQRSAPQQPASQQSTEEPAAEKRTGTDDRRKQHERRRVPSWDEIMFGGRDS